MGIDYLVCKSCGEAFPDVIDYGWCNGCGSNFCEECKRDLIDMDYKYDEEDGDFLECPECNKPVLDKERFNTLMYALTKHAASNSFVNFLDTWGLTKEDYDSIKEYLKDTYGIKPYI